MSNTVQDKTYKINFSVNNQPYSVKGRCSLSELMKKLNLEGKSGMAIAVNDQVIPKEKWNEAILHSNDNVLIINATQGG